MAKTLKVFPVVDLFAGPGGLGEGFASLAANGRPRFRSVASIERDDFSHQTLLMRHFFRHFSENEVPDDYYDFLAGRIEKEALFSRHPSAYEAARTSALKISLGKESRAQVRHSKVPPSLSSSRIAPKALLPPK